MTDSASCSAPFIATSASAGNAAHSAPAPSPLSETSARTAASTMLKHTATVLLTCGMRVAAWAARFAREGGRTLPEGVFGGRFR